MLKKIMRFVLSALERGEFIVLLRNRLPEDV